MQWLLAIIAMAIAAAANENVIVWGILGFLAGHILTINSRTAKLERQFHYLRTEMSQLKTQLSTAMPSVEAAEQQAEFSTTPPQNDFAETAEIVASPPVVDLPTQPQLEENIYLSDAIPDSLVQPVAEIPADLFQSEPVVQIVTEIPSDLSNRKPATVDLYADSFDMDKFIKFIWDWFTDGNTFVRVGIVILFVGVSFLFNLAVDRGYIPIELRLSAVAASAVGLLILGWHLREKHTGYALLIQGGAVGLLYLTIFASYNLYHLLPSALAFVLLVLIVALSAALAVLENTVSLALFGSIGGFLAPILTSSGTNNYIGLFSFYAVLNAGIFAIAWFKAWRILNLVGFTFTFSIGAFWGATRYQPENFAPVEPFLILFFLFYVGIALLYATRRAPDFKDYIDGTLIFGTPILAFGLQAAMVKDYEYGVAISAFVLGLFYLNLAQYVWKHLGESLKFLSETLLAVCVIFVTLAVPFAMDGSTTSATWAVEATGVLWVSIRQEQFVRRVFALGLQACAGIALISDATTTHGIAFFNSAFIGVVILSFCAGLSSWMLSWDFSTRRSIEKAVSPLLLAYSLLWLFLGFYYQIYHHGLRDVQNDLMLSLTIVMTAFLIQIGRWLNWNAAKNAALSMMIPLILGTFVLIAKGSHPSAGHGIVLWSLAFAVYFFSLKTANHLTDGNKLTLHIFTGLFLATLVYWEGFWQLLLVSALLSLLFNDLASRYQWSQLRVLALGLFPMMVFLAFSSLSLHSMHPFELPDTRIGLTWAFEPGYLLWLLAFSVLYWLFYDVSGEKIIKSPSSFRGLSLLLLVVLCTWESSWHLTNYFALSNGWHVALFPLFACAALGLMLPAKVFPFTHYQKDYFDWAAQPLIWGLMLWSVLALKTPANSNPLPWLPLLNPAELMQAMVLLMVIRFTFLLPEERMTAEQKHRRYKHIAYFTFVWLNFMLLRAIHHWGDLPWSLSLLDRSLTQTCLSIFWTLCGLSLTIVATQKQQRKLWISGAVLLVVVVVKLFLLDLHSHDSMERIISFITVGGLLMLIGYFAPLPPKVQESENVESDI